MGHSQPDAQSTRRGTFPPGPLGTTVNGSRDHKCDYRVWEVLNGVGVDGVGGIDLFCVVRLSSLFGFSSFFLILFFLCFS